jgi:hypothetical protein
VIHFVFNRNYGYFRDELYYLACGQHLDWGYVDQPPLIAVIARLSRVLFGDSLSSIRLFPALASGARVVLTGLLVREFGGRAWATILACVAVLLAPVYLGTDNLLTMNSFESLFWMACAYIVARIANGVSPRLWLWLGVIAGFGLENKHSMTFFGLALGTGVLLTPLRRHFRDKWIWLGGLIAFAIALPNIVWEVRHHWATWELLRNVANSGKNVINPPLEFLWQQVLIMNPLNAPLWIGGLIWLLSSRDGRRWRALGIAYLAVLALMIVLHGKHYYMAPAYPMLLAAGGVAAERLFALRLRWLKPVALAAPAVVSMVLAPTIMPIIPPQRVPGYMKAIHFEPPRTEVSHVAALPQVLADQFGWQEMVASVARAYNALPATDRAKACIFASNYGQAAAIDFFGPHYGLPPAISGHQSYFFWGPRGCTGEVILAIDDRVSQERQRQFASIEDAGQIQSSPFALIWEQRMHVYICRGFRYNLAEFWPKTKKWI